MPRNLSYKSPATTQKPGAVGCFWNPSNGKTERCRSLRLGYPPVLPESVSFRYRDRTYLQKESTIENSVSGMHTQIYARCTYRQTRKGGIHFYHNSVNNTKYDFYKGRNFLKFILWVMCALW